MLIEGTIRQEVLGFSEGDREQWKKSNPSWLVKNPPHRFMYSASVQEPFETPRRTHYFSQAWFIAQHIAEYKSICWHERYKLAEHRKSGPMAEGNKEIFGLMGAEYALRLQRINAAYPEVFGHLKKPKENSKVVFKDPDVISYAKGRWGIYELKSAKEETGFLQEESLALLERIIPNVDVSIVRLVKDVDGFEIKPIIYSFEFPDELLKKI